MSVSQIVAFALLGIGTGGLIAGIGLGVVLSYRGAGVINLAAGSIAMLAGFCYWALRTGEFGITFATGWAVTLTMLFSLAVGIIFELGLVRPMRRQTPLAKLVATLGFLLTAQAAVVLAFGEEARMQPEILPQNVVVLFHYAIPTNRFWIGGIVLALTLVFLAAYRWSRFGLGTRAASENEAYATLFGLSPNRLSMTNTLLMSLTMGLIGLIAASIAEVDNSTLLLMIIPALAAAIFGRFTSFLTTFVAGMIIGMAESVLLLASTQSWFPTNGGIGIPIPGVQELMIFIILVIAMFFRAGKIPGRGDIVERRLPRAPRPIAPLKATAKWVPICAVALWALPFGFREGLITSLIAAISLLSLVVITGFVGQLSVVQLALAGVGGFTVSHFFTNFGIAFPWAAIIGVLFATAIGLIAGFPALRVRGVSLVVVTLAAADAIENFGFSNTTWGAAPTGSAVPSPSLFGFNFGPDASLHGLDGNLPSPLFGWFCLLVLTIVALWVCNLRRSSLGQEMLAVRANERAAAAAGINVRNVKLIGFAIAAAIAGVSGVLLAYSYGSITPDSYDTIIALSLIAFIYICGITTVPGAIQGGLIYVGGLLAYALLDWFGLQGNWLNFAVGFLLVGSLVYRPDGGATYLFYGPKKPFNESRLGRILGRGTPPSDAGRLDEPPREPARVTS